MTVDPKSANHICNVIRRRLHEEYPDLAVVFILHEENKRRQAIPKAAAQTTSPLALTAEWGMGKSSAMRLLQKQLRDRNMPTIWFNAWHHQNEEHLFAALMEQIRRDAAPGPSRLE